MKILTIEQNTQEWLDARALSDGTASELSAAAGKSKYTSRDKLLRQKSTGLVEEVNSFTQSIFDKGHAAEYAARSLADEIAGGELYPMTATIDVDDMVLLASFDGISMDESIIFEHKLFNKKLAENVESGTLDDHYTLQMDQQLLISGADKCLFMCSDGTQDNMAYCWYQSTPEKLANVVKIWKQFHDDLASYNHVETVETPKAEPIKDLPSVTVVVKGELTRCNIDDVRPQFDKFLSNALIDLVTDDDFAQAEAESKIGRETAKRCIATAKSVVDQTLTISEVTRELEQYAAKFNAIALKQEKAVNEQKEARKLNAKREREKAFSDHVFSLNEELKPITLVCPAPDFIGAMKSQRLLSSLYDKLDSALANGKIQADAIAKDIRAKLSWYNEYVTATQFLFTDLQNIITNNSLEAFQSIVKGRVSDYAKEQEAKAESERKRIQAEEQRIAEARAAKIIKDEADRVEALRKQKQAEEDAMQRQEQRFRAEALEAERIDEELTRKSLESARIAQAEQDKSAIDRRSETSKVAHLREKADDFMQMPESDKPEIEPTVAIDRVPTLTIAVSEHQYLCDRNFWLECLEAAGVDKWTGYHYAMQLYQPSESYQGMAMECLHGGLSA